MCLEIQKIWICEEFREQYETRKNREVDLHLITQY
jgi:hypothetical protein